MKNKGEKFAYIPIFCNLNGKSVVVIGGGNVAERKIRGLLKAGAQVTLISPETTDSLGKMVQEGLIRHISRAFRPGDLDGAWLVIAATSDRSVQDAVFQEAQARRIFCNVVDEPRVCSFIVPSMVRRDELCLAISTGGLSPALAKALRKEFEKRLGPEWGTFVSLLGKLRNLLLQNHQGKAVTDRCSRLADLDVPEWIKQNQWSRVEKWASDICGEQAKTIVQEFARDG